MSGVVEGNFPGIGFSEGTGNGEKLDWTLIVPIEVLALADALAIDMDAALTELAVETALAELKIDTVPVELALEKDPAAELETETTVLADLAPEDDAILLTAAEPSAQAAISASAMNDNHTVGNMTVGSKREMKLTF